MRPRAGEQELARTIRQRTGAERKRAHLFWQQLAGSREHKGETGARKAKTPRTPAER